jgi:hypothetical protein
MLYRFCVSLLRPYPLTIFLLLTVQAILWRRKIGSLTLRLALLLPTLLLWFVSLPVVSYFSAGSLEWQYPPIYERPPNAGAIVVLGSGVAPPDAVRKKAELDTGGLRRCIKAVEFYKSGKPCPIVVTGGRVEDYKKGPVMAGCGRDGCDFGKRFTLYLRERDQCRTLAQGKRHPFGFGCERCNAFDPWRRLFSCIGTRCIRRRLRLHGD